MTKENDYFLELMSNPTFSPKDFLLVGLNSENTGILDASIYKKAKIVLENPLFQTDGKFDENKFNKAYEQALYQYNDLARLTETSKPFFRDDIFAPDTLKGSKDTPEFVVTKVQNPLRQLESFVNFGTKEVPTQSVREIAQANPTFDYKTGKWTDSPNETWFDNFINPKVLAQWDFDADENGNPTNDSNKIVYHKGEKKIDPITGTYYYETLGGRDIYGREVLSGFDTLTVDGSTANKYDFFDSDGIDKSIKGSIARAVTQIAPVFIPYIGEAYIGSRIALSMSELIPTIGKIFTGSDNEFLSKIEGINKALSFSTSDYTQGSQEAGMEANPWTMETGLKLISDVFTQLAEQRWIFKYGQALFAGVNPKIIGETEKAQKARLALIEANAAKSGFNLDVLKQAKSLEELLTLRDTERAINFARAKTTLDQQLKAGQKWAKHLSMAYMTGITTASSYGEAKQQGASDTEAALFALGYTAGEYALLSSDIGQWILPELKLEKYLNQSLARALSKITREAGDSNAVSTVGKLKWYKELFNYGKQLATLDYSDSVLRSASKMTISSMLSEGIEETSEELLLDLSKTLFNVANALRSDETRFDDAWKDMATRYGMSFIGGTVGGGIATALPGYRAARAGRTIKDSDAYQELVHIVSNGQTLEFIETVLKMDLGNKDLSMSIIKNSDGTVSYKPAENYENSQDYAIKQELIKQVNIIDDILNSEGAKLSQDSLLNDKLIRRELKYHSLLLSNVLGVYTNEFNNLLSDLVDVSKQINDLESAKLGNNPSKTDTLNREDKREFSESDEQKLSELKKELKALRDRIEKYKNGSVANEFIGEALFELDTQISSAYGPTDFRRWAEEQSNKKFEELSDTERSELQNRWKEASINRRDIVHRAYQVFKKNQQILSDLLKKHEEEYFLDNNSSTLRNLESLFLEREGSLSQSRDIVGETSSFIPGETRLMIWEGLLNNLKDLVDKDTYNSLKSTFDNLEISYIQSLNLEQLPQSLEELNNMDSDAKLRLIEDLGLGEDFNPASDLDLMNAIHNRELEYNSLKYEEYKSGWAIFLSNQLVLDEFIKTLKNAKYLTPTTKLYIKDFINRADITDESKSKINQALEEVSSSPIEELLSTMVTTLQESGFDTTGMVADLASFMSDLANSNNIENFSYSPEMDLKIRRTLDLIEIAHSHIEAAKTEIFGDLGNLYGYNATINELLLKYPIEGQENVKLTLLKASTANSLLYELAKLHNDLKFYLAIFNANTNAKLTDHIKTDLKLNTLYFGNLKKWSIEIPDDWEGKDEVTNAINTATTIQSVIDNNKESLTREERVQIIKERLNIELGVYNLFQKNLGKDLKWVFNSLNLLPQTQTLLNSGVTSQTDRDFIWYLASIAAANPTLVSNEFKNTISSKYAPIIAQEEAIKRAYSFILNPQIFEHFAQTYNEVYKELVTANRAKNGETRTDFDTDEFLLSAKHFLIEGIPGSGKTSATYTGLYNMLKANHPELLTKIWFVSNSKENALNASESMENVTSMSKEEYFRKIGIGYNQEYDENGLVKVDPSKLIEDENGVNHFKDVTINEGIETPTLIFFDEVSSFSQLDLLLSEDFLKAKGIYAFAAGDFDLIGALGKFKDINDNEVFVRLANSNFIGSWKLGSSMRSNNTYKSKNIAVARESIKEYSKKLGLYNQGGVVISPIKFSYYESQNEGIFGDKVVNFEDVPEWEQSIRTMLDTLNEGEVLNYISDDSSTQLYLTLKALNEGGKYLGKINFLDAKASQGLEGQYYIIELSNSFNNAVRESNPKLDNTESAINFGKTIYTAISRAKQGSLIVGNYTAETVFSLFESVKQNTLQINNLSQQAILNFGNERKSLLNEVLGEINENTKLTRDIPIEPILKETEEPSGDDITEEETNINNLDKPSTITNNEEDKLNILMHSFMCQETGCETVGGKEPTDPNVSLKLGRYFDRRIDNLNGLAQIDKRSQGLITLSGIEIDSNGNIIEGKDKLLNILNRIRNLACYTKDKESLIRLIQQNLGTTIPLRVDFVYKNQFRDYDNEAETIDWYNKHPEYLKFYKGRTEYLAGIFNEDNIDDAIREPKDLTIEAIITLSDGTQLLEVPLCKMTSPLTLLNTSEFEGLKLVFDSVGQDISKFKLEIKRLLQQNSNIPHLREYAKLIELYSGSAYNTISYFDENFTLANYTKVTGITTTSHEKGADYFKTLGYYYNGKWIALDEYKLRMPWRKISKIFTSVETDGRKVVELNGSEILVGKPFVLVSDYYTNLSDSELLNMYLKLCKDKSEPLIRLVYVTPPTATIQEYVFNLNNALTKNKDNAENVDKDLGTKITAFRLLLFALSNNSNFRNAFLEWINNSAQSNKDASINRMEAVSNLIKTLVSYEQKEGNGKLYELLNTPIKNVDRKIVETLKYNDGLEDKWIMSTLSTLTLRHVLQQELHKMLLSDQFYGDSLQSKLLKKLGNEIIFPDSVKGKINAFIQDAENNRWTGVQYHLKLKPQSTQTIFDLSFAEIDTNIGSEYSVSGKPIQINGKLDSTSFILDVVPLMDWIIKGGLGRNIDVISTDSNNHIFADGNSNLKAHNTLRYLSENIPNKENSLNKQFGEILSGLEFSKGTTRANKSKLTEAFNSLSESEKNQVLQDPRLFIFDTIGLLSKEINGKLVVIKNLNDAQDIIYLSDNIIFRRSSDLSKVYSLTNLKEVIPITKEEFLKMTKDVKSSPAFRAILFAFDWKSETPPINPEFNVEESLNSIVETFKNISGLTLDTNIEEILKNVLFLANPMRIARLSNIYEKDPLTGQWTFTSNGNIYATILALVSPKVYNKLVNDSANHDILLNLLTELPKINSDFIQYIELLIKELNNDVCSFKSPF